LKFPYVVTDAASESLLIIARTKQYRAWTATLSWTDGERTGTKVIDFDGKPFMTSATAHAVEYDDTGEGKWSER
jgi:hypothetical protein